MNVNSDMPTLVGRVRETQARIAAASGRVHTAVLAVEELEAERSEEAAQSAVEQIRTDIEAAKDRAGQVVDVAKNLLQGKWKDAGVDLAAVIGEELIGAAIDAAYAGDLAVAEEELSEARANLERVQDERHASILNSAVNELRAANEAANVAQAALLAGARRVEQAHATLVETLDERGLASAATALEARVGVRQAAARAAIDLHEYMELITSIRSRSNEFARLSATIADFLQSPGGEAYVPASGVRTNLWVRANDNRGMSETLEEWSIGEAQAAQRAEDYLRANSYMEPYRQIDTALQQALAHYRTGNRH